MWPSLDQGYNRRGWTLFWCDMTIKLNSSIETLVWYPYFITLPEMGQIWFGQLSCKCPGPWDRNLQCICQHNHETFPNYHEWEIISLIETKKWPYLISTPQFPSSVQTVLSGNLSRLRTRSPIVSCKNLIIIIIFVSNKEEEQDVVIT